MKLLPCARKMSATSTVGRLTLPFSVGHSACHRVLKWEELRWGCARPASDVEKDGGRWSWPPNPHDRAAPEWFSNRSHVRAGASPSCVEASAEIPSSGYLHVGPLR